MDNPNVIIFGETGAGKSSLVNLIAGKDLAEMSSRAIGCTFQSAQFTVNIGDKKFDLHDTAGLDEGQSGTVTKHDAIVQCYKLLRKLHNGVSLLIFCMRAPRIKESCVQNWKLFRDIICQKEIPVILAVTGLENLESMDDWWTENKDHFRRYGMHPNGVACVTGIRGKKRPSGKYTFGLEYDESKKKLRRMIGETYLETPWRVPAAVWFTTIVETSYTSGKRPEEITQTREAIGSATKELVTRCEMTKEEAKELGRKLEEYELQYRTRST